MSLSPARGENLFSHKRGSIAHSLSLSSAHHPNMTEILLKRTYIKLQVIHHLSGTYFCGSKGVQAIEVQLFGFEEFGIEETRADSLPGGGILDSIL